MGLTTRRYGPATMEDSKEKSRRDRRKRPDGDLRDRSLAEPLAGYTPEQREAYLMGQRILVRIVVRDHIGRQTASLEAEQDGGEEE